MMLPELALRSALRSPGHVAVSDAAETVTYGELDRLANQLARALADLEVRPGDRVAVWLDRSTAGVIAAQAILRLGAVYVPVDPSATPDRARELLIDAGPRVLISTDARASEALTGEVSHLTCVTVDETCRGISWSEVESYEADPVEDILTSASDVATLLYPSSENNLGKGVCLTHAALLASVTWMAAELRLSSTDRLASQAPAADILALVDQHAAFLMGAGVSMVPESLQHFPGAVLAFLGNQRATAWTSHAAVLDAEDLSKMRAATAGSKIDRILVSGRPPAPSGLRQVADAFPTVRVVGVFGTPETGLCAWYEPGDVAPGRIPVGTACAGARIRAVGPDGEEVRVGEEGELVVQGPSVLLGHWGRPLREGLPYFTGRTVRRESEEEYAFTGKGGGTPRERGSRRRAELVERI